jgi:hypothetical protein
VLQETLSKSRVIQKAVLERRASEVLESAQAANSPLNEFLKMKSDDLRRVRDRNRQRDDSVVAAWRDLKRQKGDLVERLEMELGAVCDEKKEIRKGFQSQMAKLRSAQQRQLHQLGRATADALRAHEKDVRARVAQVRVHQSEVDRLRSELAALRSADCARPAVSSSGSFDFSDLHEGFAAALEQRAVKCRSRIDALANAHARKEADCQR